MLRQGYFALYLRRRYSTLATDDRNRYMCLFRTVLRFGARAHPSLQTHIRADSPSQGNEEPYEVARQPRMAVTVAQAPREERDAPVESICACVRLGAFLCTGPAQLALGTFFTGSPWLAGSLPWPPRGVVFGRAATSSSSCRRRHSHWPPLVAFFLAGLWTPGPSRRLPASSSSFNSILFSSA
ncbi:hypothetical protein HPB50_002266 [Hyalomma asiaticum]|uniref:Uncharacterized protein n=1 Tax=Hyalomma asiaticum TaxID=266040 RepID=A0ACB7TH82_HYAAI|nr:hypothetical protein HPB50_002266 [Hyalomma asiaticum]